MQIIYISNRPDILSETLAFVRAFMGFLDDVLVFSPACDLDAFRAIGGSFRLFDEDELLGAQSEEFHQTHDHARRNYIIRSRLAYFPEVASAFIMSDDDSRPLSAIPAEYFVSRERYQPFFFYVLEKWEGILGKRRTSYDLGNLNTYKALKDAGVGTVLFSAHMPQIVDRELFRASVEFFRPALAKYGSITEWETYFNFAIDVAPERFHAPRPFTVLGWPDKPHWPWFVRPTTFDFENFYPEAYIRGGLFEGLPRKYDPATHAAVTADKVRRHSDCFAKGRRRRHARQKRRKIVRGLLMPRRSLQRIADQVANFLAPRHRQPGLQRPAAPIEIAGMFGSKYGSRTAASMLARTLEQCAPAGAITKLDVSAFFEASRSDLPEAPPPRTDTPILIVCLNPPHDHEYLYHVRRALLSKKWIVGHWSSDSPAFPKAWESNVEDFNEIWVSSRFTFERWRKTLGPRLRWVPLDLRDADNPTAVSPSHPHQPRSMLSTFNLDISTALANPGGAIEVLQRIRYKIGPHISLTLRIDGLAAHPNAYVDFLRQLGSIDDGLTVIAGDLPDEKIRSLIDGHDVFISMHRAVGLSLQMAQAMSRGKVVLATGWSGNMDFMDEGSAVLIDHTLHEMRDVRGGNSIVGAEPDIEDATVKIIDLLGDMPRMRALGERARAVVATVSEARLAQVRSDLFS